MARARATTVLSLLAVLLAAGASARAGDALRTDHLDSRLVAEQRVLRPGEPARIGLWLQHDPGWHTYWRNPGDSGLATRLQLTLPEGVTADPIDWPAPQRFEVEGIVNFGYGGRVLLPLRLHVPAGFAADRIEIRARASWLVCEIGCIPGRGDYTLSLPLGARSAPDPRWQADFARSDAARPLPLDASARYRVVGERVQVDLRGASLPRDIAAWTVFPAQPQVVANDAWPQWSRIDGGLRLTLPRSPAFVQAPARFALVLTQDARALAVNATLAAD